MTSPSGETGLGFDEVAREAFVSSAPGKAILMGEHAAVYGRPALVAAVELRFRVLVRAAAGEGLRVELPQLRVNLETSWSAEIEQAAAVRSRWQEFEEGRLEFEGVAAKAPADAVRAALGEAAGRLPAARLAVRESEGVVLRLESDLPIGAGLGSSAALAVSVCAAVFHWFGHSLTPAELDSAALDVERRLHGRPSGVDSLTSRQGGLLWVTGGGGRLVVDPVDAGQALTSFQLVSSGAPSTSTGEVVSGVRRRFEERPRDIEVQLQRIEEASRRLRAVLEGGRRSDLAAPIRDCHRALVELGVVPEPVQQAISELESAGGAGKISGAGCSRGPGAGALLVIHPEPQAVEEFITRHRYAPIPGALGARGVSLESQEL